jgi:plasmid stabilization system protein ParE
MSIFVLTPHAKEDIVDIWTSIADDNENAADRVERAIFAACAFVAEAPCAATSGPTSLVAPFVSGR